MRSEDDAMTKRLNWQNLGSRKNQRGLCRRLEVTWMKSARYRLIVHVECQGVWGNLSEKRMQRWLLGILVSCLGCVTVKSSSESSKEC